VSTGTKPIERASHALQRLPLVGLAPRPVDLLPLLRMGGLRWLWSCEAVDLDWAARFGVELLSLEDALGTRKRWRGVDVDALLPLVNPYVSTPTNRAPFGLIPYSLTNRWRAALADAQGLRVAPSLGAWPLPELTDKIRMRRWLRDLQVPLPRYLGVRRTDVRYAHLVLRLGSHFVLQTPAGSAGVGTYLIENTGDVERALTEHPQVETWLASSYVGDRTLNIHGLVTSVGDVVVTRPSVQLSNLAVVGSAFGAYGGSDFRAPFALPDWVLHRCRLIVRGIGQSLAARGHRGIFGVDFAVDDQDIAVLEVNGRIQASTWLLGEVELENGEVPTLSRHVVEAYDDRLEHRPSGEAADGVQLVVRLTGRESMRVAVRPQPGVYRHRAGNLLWRRGGVGLLDCGPDEVVISDLPGASVALEPGAVLARLVTRQSLTTSNGQALTPEATALLAALHAAVSLIPCGEALSSIGGR
jgi:ATP-grasp domain-containing protein